MKDIAKRANVVPMTVSLALRDRVGVSEEKREEIKRIARQMGYKPSFFAHGLQGQRTHSIGIMWSLWGGPPMEMVRDLSLRAMHRNYVSYVVDSLSDPAIISRTLDELSRRRVDAMVAQCIPGQIPDALKKFPAAVAVSEGPWKGGVDYINYDRRVGIREMARHFVNAGRRRPMVLFSHHANLSKAQAFLDEFRQLGVEPASDANVMLPDRQQDVTKDAIEHAVGRREWFPDAIFATTDRVAAAGMQWLKDKGKRIPRDVAIGGFNDDELCLFVTPQLASVQFNSKLLADEIDRLILTRLEDSTLPPRNVTVPMTFVYRESAG